MAGSCRDAHRIQLPAEHDAGSQSCDDWPPLRWALLSVGVLGLISLGLGSALKWLLQ